MVKKKNYYISRRRNNRLRFYRAIYNFHATKISVSSILEYTGSTIKFKISDQSYMNIPDSLAAAPDWKQYATIFNSFKLRAIKITVSPHAPVGGFIGGTVQIGVLTNDDTNNFADVVESNRSMIASQTDVKTLYVNFGSGSTGWIGIQRYGDLPGKIVAGASEQSSSGVMRWDINVDYYLIYKNEL